MINLRFFSIISGVDDTDGQPGTSADCGEQDGTSRDDTSDRSDGKHLYTL